LRTLKFVVRYWYKPKQTKLKTAFDFLLLSIYITMFLLHKYYIKRVDNNTICVILKLHKWRNIFFSMRLGMIMMKTLQIDRKWNSKLYFRFLIIQWMYYYVNYIFTLYFVCCRLPYIQSIVCNYYYFISLAKLYNILNILFLVQNNI